MRRILIIFTVMVIALTLMFPAAAAAAKEGDGEMPALKTKDYYEDILKREIQFVSTLAFNNGVIGMFPLASGGYRNLTLPEIDGVSPDEYRFWPSSKVVPYFSDSAVLGVIKAAELIGGEDNKARLLALNYINWYVDHMNTAESDINGVAGTVYDYFVFQNSTDGRIIELTLHDAYASSYPSNNPYDYDSTDSYAAMFLEILYDYTRVFDNAFLDGKTKLVDTLINVIMSTYVTSIDLTYAKPNYAVCYLMDNCEVYAGFIAAAKIYDEFYGDDEKAAFALEKADKIKTAILGRMWVESSEVFASSVYTNGKHAAGLDVTEFYPQASSQLFPVLFGLLAPDDPKAITVYNRFKANFCQDGEKGKDWSAYDVKGMTYPWCILLRAVVGMKDFTLAQKYIDTIYKRFIIQGHKDPYYNAESGAMLLSLTALLEFAPAAEKDPEPSSEESGEEVSSQSQNDNGESLLSLSPEKGGGKKTTPPWIYAGAGVAVIAAALVVFLVGKKYHKNS